MLPMVSFLKPSIPHCMSLFDTKAKIIIFQVFNISGHDFGHLQLRFSGINRFITGILLAYMSPKALVLIKTTKTAFRTQLGKTGIFCIQGTREDDPALYVFHCSGLEMVKGGLAGPDSLKALYGIALPAIFVGTDAVLLTAAALGSVLKLKQQNEDGEFVKVARKTFTFGIFLICKRALQSLVMAT